YLWPAIWPCTTPSRAVATPFVLPLLPQRKLPPSPEVTSGAGEQLLFFCHPQLLQGLHHILCGGCRTHIGINFKNSAVDTNIKRVTFRHSHHRHQHPIGFGGLLARIAEKGKISPGLFG